MNRHIVTWQTKLKELEFYPGEIDGDFGPMSLAASMEVLDADEIEKTVLAGKELVIPEIDFKYTPPRRNVFELIWHCAATPEGRDYTVEDIDRWHKQRGWSGNGYQFVVYRDGAIHVGRSNERTGAHVGGKNTGRIGAVYIGGVTSDGKRAKDTRTAAQRASMLWLTKEIAKDRRIKRISGHNEYAAKACPSFDVRSDELGNIPGFKRGKRNG